MSIADHVVLSGTSVPGCNWRVPWSASFAPVDGSEASRRVIFDDSTTGLYAEVLILRNLEQTRIISHTEIIGRLILTLGFVFATHWVC